MSQLGTDLIGAMTEVLAMRRVEKDTAIAERVCACTFWTNWPRYIGNAPERLLNYHIDEMCSPSADSMQP